MRTLLIVALCLTPFLSNAQDTLHVGSTFETSLLDVGESKTYLHYQVLKDGRMLPRSMKEININKEGDDFRIVQKEYSPKKTKTLESTVDAQTLTTDTHMRTSADKRESYRYTNKSVTGIPDDEEAINNDFQLELSEPTFNFEIDFIFLQSIDWNDHKSVVLNFYHPGGQLPPAFYTFGREKEETITLASGTTVDTWVIFTDYNGQSPARFWISKEKNEIIRQETDVMDMAGFKFVKRLIKS